LVAACAECGTDYVDITGETGWAGEMRISHGEAAKRSGARIISFCGFDSVPSDISIFAAVQALQENLANSSIKVDIEEGTTWHFVEGGVNGGTIHTVMTTPLNLGRCFSQPVPFLADDPLVLSHPRKRFDPDLQATKNRMAKAEWLNQLLSFDSFMMMGVSAPFFMAIANAKVVYASAVSLNYGPNFVYRERVVPIGFQATTRLMLISIIPAIVFQLVTALVLCIVKIPIAGQKLVDYFLPPGSGPSDESCRSGKVEVYAEVTTSKDNLGNIHRANCYMKFQGDPGNFVTAQCLSESAWCLLLNRNDLPPRSDDGFGTPAELLGSVLLKRLKTSKVRPVQVSTNVRQNVPKLEWVMHR
jgi:short subunit dehydrogenase-like uncharacterized protein